MITQKRLKKLSSVQSAKNSKVYVFKTGNTHE